MRKMIVPRALELAIYFLILGRPTCSMAQKICVTSHYPRQGSLPFVKLCCAFCGEREENKSLRKAILVQGIAHCKELDFFNPSLFEEVQTYLN